MATVTGEYGKMFVSSSVAAAGANQAAATLLTLTNNIVTGADSAKGVRLPPATVGGIYYITNNEATNRLIVYPATGEKIISSVGLDHGTNGGVNIGGYNLGIFVCAIAGVWHARLGFTYYGNNSDWDIGTGQLQSKRIQNHVPDTVTATADGLTTGLIPGNGIVNATYVTVTSDDANKAISLPAGAIGDRIRILLGSTGCELWAVTAGDKVNDVTVGATNEAALTAENFYDCSYVATNKWVVIGTTKLGAVQAALVPDAR